MKRGDGRELKSKKEGRNEVRKKGWIQKIK